MKKTIHSIIAAVVCGACVYNAAAQGTVFTYQGRLTTGSNPASGSYDFRFRLASDPLGNNYIGSAFLTNAVPVSGGLFTAGLDFGAGIFTGADYWLQVDVRTNGAGGYTTLVPLQRLTPAPYALYAPTAGAATVASTASAVAAGSIGTGALQAGAVDSTSIANGTITAIDLSPGLVSNTFWRLDGNSGTTPGARFLGTTDNQPLEFKVNGLRALRLEDNGDGSDPGSIPDGAPNVVVGSPWNFVGPGVVGATISGGGATNYYGATTPRARKPPRHRFAQCSPTSPISVSARNTPGARMTAVWTT